MTKRSINDEEISLIKAMILRGMKNKDIQFFFNRPDRPVNSGRITDISNGKYSDSANIPAASDDEVKYYIERFEVGSVSASIMVPAVPLAQKVSSSPVALENIRTLFIKGENGFWRLSNGESDQIECKANFGIKYPGAWMKAIAALSNNRGGYIFFGVSDKDGVQDNGIDMSYTVRGMNTDEFYRIDVEEISKKLKSLFDPTPRIQLSNVKIGGKNIGVIYVYQHGSRPVIALKNEGEHIKEGDIFFRYPGQSSRIKYGDLRSILDERDAQVRLEILPMVEKILALGPNKAMVADLQSGVLTDGKGPILIDESLLDKINFIKEGKFSESDGGPTLRLIGDVQPMESAIILKKGFLTAEDIIRDFINQETPYDSGEYVRCAVEGMKGDWFPIHYFARKANLDDSGLVNLINATSATSLRKNVFVSRAIGTRTAYKECSGTPLLIKLKIENQEKIEINSEKDVSYISLAISGLKARPFEDIFYLMDLLKKCHNAVQENQGSASTSFLRRAVCRVDDLYFGLNAKA